MEVAMESYLHNTAKMKSLWSYYSSAHLLAGLILHSRYSTSFTSLLQLLLLLIILSGLLLRLVIFTLCSPLPRLFSDQRRRLVQNKRHLVMVSAWITDDITGNNLEWWELGGQQRLEASKWETDLPVQFHSQLHYVRICELVLNVPMPVQAYR